MHTYRQSTSCTIRESSRSIGILGTNYPDQKQQVECTIKNLVDQKIQERVQDLDTKRVDQCTHAGHKTTFSVDQASRERGYEQSRWIKYRKTQWKHEAQRSITQDRQVHWSPNKDQTHSPKVISRHRENQEPRQERGQRRNQTGKHRTSNDDRTRTGANLTAAPTETEVVELRNRPWTAPTYYDPHRNTPGNSLNLTHQNCSPNQSCIFSRIGKYKQKPETTRNKLEKFRKHDIVTSKDDHMTACQHKLQETKESSTG